MNAIVFFDQVEAGLVSIVGGKGSNLITLTVAGFPVPAGFIVTAESYRQFIEGIDWLEQELTTFDYAHPDHLREQCANLRHRLAEIELPEPVRLAVSDALARTGSAKGNEAFAVRSSSTFEDLAQAAFAGQHDTFLNVRGAAALSRRIRDCTED